MILYYKPKRREVIIMEFPSNKVTVGVILLAVMLFLSDRYNLDIRDKNVDDILTVLIPFLGMYFKTENNPGSQTFGVK